MKGHQTSRTKWKIPTLKVLGSLLLFLSWLCQNYVQKNWQDEREDLDRLRDRITVNDVLANVWYSAFIDQLARPKIDLIPTSTIGLQYINFSHQVRAAAARWTNNQNSELLKQSKGYLDSALKARETGELSEIFDLTRKARALDERVASEWVPDIEAKYQKIREAESQWGVAFVVLYILGASSIGVAFLLSNRTVVEEPPKHEPKNARHKF